ncbi:peptidase MA family metallohydrolase [Hyalangium rubrum]|uniref:Peptidase MA family metallohydrolase n=1 Tax=Hyalangium rubrum TaxID=3103134 RepID=A0ABU5HIN7_9BACT|nr:peptidase MA family metallohydrolase [Hyalangium sp. s54d21]MDY7233019.1 peptidase MA family metallohydrolase [Hyalangium sp. s54d21]
MSPLLLALLLTAAPPPQQAQQLAKAKKWEDLYLAYSSADPTGYSDEQRKAIAGPLLKGCEALVANDAVMAFSLGDRSVAFEETASGLRCLARAALATDQRGTAEEALRKGLERFPKEGAFGLELGKLLLGDKDAPGAIEALSKVPTKGPQAAEAKKLLQKAKSLSAEEGKARAEVENIERRMSGEGPGPRGSTQPAIARDEGNTQPTSLTYESGVGEDGMRTRANRRFVMKYFNNNRDFGQRAEYEGRVIATLEEAYEHTRSILGEAREGPVDVILYTRQEFRTHMGSSLANAAAGLYSDQAIRINDAAELTQQTKATLVHEYVHAAVDEFCGGGHRLPTWLNEGLAEYVEWRYLGGDGPPVLVGNALRGAARAGRLPSLTALSQGALIQTSDPAMAYATSAVAVRELMNRGGAARLLALIRDVGQGTPFDQALQSQYGMDVAKLDEEVKSSLSKR